MLDVVALGELLIDFAVVDAGEDGYPVMAARPGGAPANFLAVLSKLGAKTALIAKVGEDAFGRRLRDTVAGLGIDTRGLILDPEVFTTLAFVTLDGQGEREFSFARKPGADTALSREETDLSLIDEGRVFHFGSLSLTDEPARSSTQAAVARAKRAGKTITFDPNLRRPLWRNLQEARSQMMWGLAQADIVKVSDEETGFLFSCGEEEAARRILALGPRLVFVTMGKDGCYCSNGRASVRVQGPADIRAVDTTGAGDIFGGAAVWKFLACGKTPEALTGEDLKDIAAFACTAAGLSTQRPGGITSVPELSEVLTRLL